MGACGRCGSGCTCDTRTTPQSASAAPSSSTWESAAGPDLLDREFLRHATFGHKHRGSAAAQARPTATLFGLPRDSATFQALRDELEASPPLPPPPGLLRPGGGGECASGDGPPTPLLLPSVRLRTTRRDRPRSPVLLAGLGEASATRSDSRTSGVSGSELVLASMLGPGGRVRTPSERLARSRTILRPGIILTPAGDVLEPPASSGSSVGTMTLAYRDTEFSVPVDWYRDYQEDLARQHETSVYEAVGKVSATWQYLDFAWADFRAAAAAATYDDGVWYDMLSCYNLPRSTAPADMVTMFWHTGWGSPYRTYLYTNLLVMTYAAQIKEVCTDALECEGFASFVELALRGIPLPSLASREVCQLRFRFPNRDATYGEVGESAGPGVFTFDCGPWALPYTCAEGFLVDRAEGVVSTPGNPWHFGLPPARFDATANEWIPQHAFESAGIAGRAWTYTEVDYGDYRAYVQDGTWHVVQRPELLAWDGFVCDWILYLGRMAYDRSRDRTERMLETQREDLRAAAYELGRYALRIIAYRGRTLIHELGHVHIGEGGHCSKGSCCFDLAANRWECALSAMLGLPMYAGTFEADRTWTAWRREWDRDYCRDGHVMTYAIPELVCAIKEPGDPSTPWAFGCTSCALGSTWMYEFSI